MSLRILGAPGQSGANVGTDGGAISAPGTSQGTTGSLFIQPGSDTRNAIQIQSPDTGWTHDESGASDPYGEGQAIVLYKSGSGTPTNQVLFRVDGGTGGIGNGGGAHLALNTNGAFPAGTQNLWLDQSAAPAAAVALIITQAVNQTGDMIRCDNHSGNAVFRIAPDKGIDGANSGPALIMENDAGSAVIGWIASGTTAPYGTQNFLGNAATTAIPLVVNGITGTTVPLFEVAVNSAAVLSVLPSGQIKNVAGNEATGAGSAVLGANCPAVTATAPYKWLKFTSSDGSQVYVPAWK